jgi:putative acetyltransferase
VGSITTRPELAGTPVARQLLAELDALLAPNYPPESRHGYSVDKMLQEQVAFFVISVDDVPAGCGGVQLFDRD